MDQKDQSGIMQTMKKAYAVYDETVNKVFTDLGLEGSKGEVSKKEYHILGEKKTTITLSKRGYFDSDNILTMHVNEQIVITSSVEMMALMGLLRYQLKINHSVDEVCAVSNDIFATIGKKEFLIKNSEGNVLLTLTIPEVFILIESIEKIWND